MPFAHWTLYILDGDEAVRESICALAASNGWHHRAFSSAKGFLEQGTILTRACLLLDWDLPEIDPVFFLPALRDHYPGLPVIVMTARDDLSSLSRIEAAGASAVLPRPFSFPELSQAVERALEPLPLHAESDRRADRQSGA